jgi:hypothetical protein
VGLSESMSAHLMMACTWVPTQGRPNRKAVHRFVGKLGFARSFRSSLRGSFGSFVSWLQRCEEASLARVQMPWAPWMELLESSILCLLAQIDVSAPWALTVRCRDAARGGHGIAYAYVPRQISRVRLFFPR